MGFRPSTPTSPTGRARCSSDSGWRSRRASRASEASGVRPYSPPRDSGFALIQLFNHEGAKNTEARKDFFYSCLRDFRVFVVCFEGGQVDERAALLAALAQRARREPAYLIRRVVEGFANFAASMATFGRISLITIVTWFRVEVFTH